MVRRVKFFDEYRDAVGYARTLAGEEGFYLGVAFRQLLEEWLPKYSPQGGIPDFPVLDVYTKRDSVRTQRPSTIEEGWIVTTSKRGPFTSVAINHQDWQRVDWLRWGTKPHPITAKKRPYLLFWYGAPLPWGPDGEGAGWKRVRTVQHTGIRTIRLARQPRRIHKDFLKEGGMASSDQDFVLMAVSTAAEQFKQEYKKSVPRVILPIRRLFSRRGGRYY